MTPKEKILQTIRATALEETALPLLDGLGMHFDDPMENFNMMLESVGGELVEGGEWGSLVKRLYPDAKVIVSNVSGCDISTLELDEIEDPHDLSTIDLAIVQAEFAVAENGAVWVKNPANRHRALYFIAEQIIFAVPRGEIVHTMHEAYERIGFEEAGFGCFISGPSKTADIEQALVIGAHGATSARVLFV
jgi:L-lactate dehydrogenase complex protein LldG